MEANFTHVAYSKPEQASELPLGLVMISCLITTMIIMTQAIVFMRMMLTRRPDTIFATHPAVTEVAIFLCVCTRLALCVTTAGLITSFIMGSGIPKNIVEIFVAMLVMSIFAVPMGLDEDT